MQSNGFLANAFAMLMLTVPAALVATKFAHPRIGWITLCGATAILSWIVGIAIIWADPPDNGFASAVMVFLGWLYMFPPLAVFVLLSLPLRRWRGSPGARAVAIGLVGLSLVLPLSACLRWIPEPQARAAAAHELRSRGHSEFALRAVQRTWEGWTIHAALPGQEDYPVYLSRSGRCMGMGGG